MKLKTKLALILLALSLFLPSTLLAGGVIIDKDNGHWAHFTGTDCKGEPVDCYVITAKPPQGN
jgi:hypothetical protein